MNASDIVFRLSVRTPTSGNVAASTPDGSLGGYASITGLGSGLDALFGDSALTEPVVPTYRCVFVVNTNTTEALVYPVVFIDAVLNTAMALAIDLIPAGPVGASALQAAVIPDESTLPTGIGEWFVPTGTGRAGLAVENIPPGCAKAVWLRRTAVTTSQLTAGCELGLQATVAPHLLLQPV